MQQKDKKFECSAVINGLEIELTNLCGANCLVCPRTSITKYGYLIKEDLDKIILLLKEGNYKELIIGGFGDAFLHKDFNDFLDYIFKEVPRIKLYIMTKGISIKQEHLNKIISLKNSGFNITLTFSIFSLDKKLFNKLTGGEYFEKFKEVFNKVRNLNIDYSMEFLLSSLNLNEYEKFKKFSQLQNKDFTYSLVHNWGGKLKKDIHKIMFDKEKLKEYYIKRTKQDICEVISSNYFYIDCFGDIFLCSVNRQKNNHIGKLENLNLKDIIEKKKLLNYTDSCDKCFYYYYKTKKED
ncbi:MAG: radical SAM protein [Candidatus Gracilibacteria bacterium]|nr:radical SAM protein [Candidatus Gracilibacteria bacterium]